MVRVSAGLDVLELNTAVAQMRGPARMVCVIVALVGLVAVRAWALRHRSLREHVDWGRFETEFRDYVQRFERAP